MDIKAKLERSRQSARECRARKKLRYQYLEELVTDREKAVFALRKELEKTFSKGTFKDYKEELKYKIWSKELDEHRWPDGLQDFLEEVGSVKQEM